MESTNLTDGSSVDAHNEIEMLIHDAYTNCVRSFASCKACAHLPPDSLQLVHDEANRFDIWATNTGSCLNSSLSSSLDHHLRNSPGTREMVVLLLRAVRVNLDYASRIFDQESETLDSLRDQDGSGSASKAQQGSASDKIVNSLSSEALQAVHGLVSQLKKLSAAIRRATANEYNVQAAKRRDVDMDGNDVGKEDEIWAEHIVNYHFLNKKDQVPGSTDEMMDIISTGLSFRMRRFRDWKRHFEKQQKRQEAIAKAELARESELLEDHEDEGAEDNKQEEDSGDTGARESVDTGGSAPPTMQGSVLQPRLAPSKQSFQSSRFEPTKSVSQSTAVSASVRSVVAGVFMDWPRPPQDPTGTGQVRCPYCFELLDKQEVSSKTKWRKHVKKDLEPYGCFYRECNKTLLKMFASEAKWIGHIRAAHMPGGTWVCRMMPHNSSPGAVVVLNTEDEFKKHLESEHAGMYPKSRIEAMANRAYRPHQTKVEDMFRDECPMRCPASLDESPKTAIVLGVPHVANHLLSLALQALPERSVRSSEDEFIDDEDGDDDDDSGNDDAGKSSSPAKKRVVRETIRDGLETLPDPSFEDPSESLTTRAERDTELQLSSDRLNFYGYLPSVQKQHREQTEICQAGDPTMEPFIKEQMGVNDVSALRLELVQREELQRVVARIWTTVSIAFKFLYLLGAFSAQGNHSLADSEEEQDNWNACRQTDSTTTMPSASPDSSTPLKVIHHLPHFENTAKYIFYHPRSMTSDTKALRLSLNRVLKLAQ
ncbi:hypothetical protein QBC43DRAFT_323136 [Cladorrhinum sp. PSN259]|nr:hypothetical protein QBC43DRAFT_323136 [Cladorrhinum sp. PSN259]